MLCPLSCLALSIWNKLVTGLTLTPVEHVMISFLNLNSENRGCFLGVRAWVQKFLVGLSQIHQSHSVHICKWNHMLGLELEACTEPIFLHQCPEPIKYVFQQTCRRAVKDFKKMPPSPSQQLTIVPFTLELDTCLPLRVRPQKEQGLIQKYS